MLTRSPSAPRIANRATRLAAAGVLGLALAGCDLPDAANPGQAAELANIKPSNVIPKSSPSQTVAAFKRYCLAPTIEAARSALRSSDYVLARRRGRFESYVVDNQKPAVVLAPSEGGFNCTVGVQARTGQQNRIDAFVAAEFPNAVPVAPSRVSRHAERAWLSPGARGVIYTERPPSGTGLPQLRFGVLRLVKL